MKLARRQFLGLAAGVAAQPAAAWALTYPTRPVRLIVGFAPGGAQDILARLIGPFLSERLGQPFIVENRPGGGGNIATETAVRAAPDGYTLVLVGPPNAINATLYDNLAFNFIRDIAPVAGIVRVPNIMEVHPSVPATTVPEFIAYAKANPGKLSMASAGVGTGPHLSGELFKMMTGVDIVHVPYRGGGPALSDMLGGQVQVKASAWYGIGAPRSTPTEIIETLNKKIDAALSDPRIKTRLADLGGMPMRMTPAEFGKFIAEETAKWAEVVRFAGAKPD